MQEVFEKIIEELEEYRDENLVEHDSEMTNHCKQDCNDVSDCTLCVLDKAIEIVNRAAAEYNNGWIPVVEELPKDGDNRYYMCIVENHEEDPPMYCQYDEECGFGFYKDIYDEHTLGFVDCEFKCYEKVKKQIGD